MDDQMGSMNWFGPPWGMPMTAEVFLPANTGCSGCLGEIGVNEQGVRIPHTSGARKWSWYHLDCFQEVVGILPVRRTAPATSSPEAPAGG